MKRKQKTILISAVLLFSIVIIGMVIFGNIKPDYSDFKDDDVVAKVGNEKIFKKDVDNRILSIKISNDAQKQALYNNLDKETANSMAEKINNPPSFEEELNNMIESAKIREYLKQINEELTVDEAKELTDTNFLNDSTANAREIALELLKTEGITKETYMDSIYSMYYDVWCQNKLFEYFEKNMYDSNAKTTLLEQYKNYRESVINQ
ncbi:MAG: SurA N-terminal domain-containing protein [Clostridia bacterium]|nr:SurA N-terminal domain-containing protein [Clostridia bacterium]